MRLCCVVTLLPILASISHYSYAQSTPYAPNTTSDNGIRIVSASFGTLGDKRKLDIVARLQELCGKGAQSCHVFCSETSFGRYNLGRKPICRVIYRCGEESVRSVEAAKEEPILMRCPSQRAEPLPASPSLPAN